VSSNAKELEALKIKISELQEKNTALEEQLANKQEELEGKDEVVNGEAQHEEPDGDKLAEYQSQLETANGEVEAHKSRTNAMGETVRDDPVIFTV
jgi:chromosome segregation ATPase